MNKWRLPEIASGNSERMKLPVVCLVFVAAISIATSQDIANKPGSCPPALPVQSCGHSCYDDSHCEGIGKCCRTQCGGSICSMPVTVARPQPKKLGSCPLVPTGRWVCTSTCNDDNDCRGKLKCCKGRCGALICQEPVDEVIESVENPVAPRFAFDY